jgi:hypothetical protein
MLSQSMGHANVTHRITTLSKPTPVILATRLAWNVAHLLFISALNVEMASFYK